MVDHCFHLTSSIIIITISSLVTRRLHIEPVKRTPHPTIFDELIDVDVDVLCR